MSATLISHFDESEFIKLLYIACKTCTSENIPTADNITQSEMKKLITSVYKSGHHSILEHVSFTFAISGVSRALSHQLVRHRAGVVFSQQSQRYVSMNNTDFVTPCSCMDDIINMEYGRILAAYDHLLEQGVKPEDARYILPNGCCTNIIMTVNMRELIHMCGLRLCTRAQWEIQDLFHEIKKQISDRSKYFADMLQPQCYHNGKCNEIRNNKCKVYKRFAYKGVNSNETK